MKVLISLGSNKGDRKKFLLKSLDSIERLENTRIIRTSQIHSYEAWGPAIATFLNMVAVIETSLNPITLLKQLQDIEILLFGRERPYKWGPRTIDIDILLIEDYIIVHPELIVPHPFMTQRRFVLEPACQIVPHWKHPIEKKTIYRIYHDFLRRSHTL